MITPELKEAGDKLVLFTIEKNAYDLPIYEQVMKLYDKIHELIGKEQSAVPMHWTEKVWQQQSARWHSVTN